MKARSILIFFACIIVVLGIMSFVFPHEGINVGKVHLRYPTIRSLSYVDSDSTAAAPTYASFADTATLTLADSVAQLRLLVDSSSLRFWLPQPRYFDDLWRSLESAQAKHRTIRILHYGDSQIEMDHISSRLRAAMQAQFGGAGPGMLPFHTVTPTQTVRQSCQGDLVHLASFGDSLATRSRGNYGVMMQSFRIEGGDASTTIRAANTSRVDERAKRFSHVTLISNNRSALSCEFADLAKKRKSKSQTIHADVGLVATTWSADSTTDAVRLRVQGNADLYAILLDADSGGVAVDNIPMRGCSGQQFTLVDRQLLTAAYATMDVGLIIMQFGGNSVPYLNSSAQISTYCTSIGRQIDYVHECCPSAKILFIGPSDMSKRIKGEMQTYPIIPELIDSLAATAVAHGAAYWSIYHAMGGHNSMLQWSRQGLAGKDYIHFSQRGADLMGDYLATAFSNSHSLYTLSHRLEQQKKAVSAHKSSPRKGKAKSGRKRRRGGAK